MRAFSGHARGSLGCHVQLQAHVCKFVILVFSVGITKRFGNSQNELGVHHMNQSAALINEKGKFEDPTPPIK